MKLVQYNECLVSTLTSHVLVFYCQGIGSQITAYTPIHFQLLMGWLSSMPPAYQLFLWISAVFIFMITSLHWFQVIHLYQLMSIMPASKYKITQIYHLRRRKNQFIYIIHQLRVSFVWLMVWKCIISNAITHIDHLNPKSFWWNVAMFFSILVYFIPI